MGEHDCNHESDFVAINRDIAHLRENIELKLTGLHGEIMSNHEMLLSEMRSQNEVLLERVEKTIALQMKTNGTVSTHTQQIEEIGKRISEERKEINKEIEYIKDKGREIIQRQWLSKWILSHPGWSIIIGLMVISVVISAIDLIGFKSLIELIK